MQSKPQQPPDKHHFVPEFLLCEWRNAEGKIRRYSRNPVGEIGVKPLAPGGMGYQRGLYSIDGFPPEHRQQVETLFMEPLDTAAADAHRLLLGGNVGALSDEQRCRWAGLVMSLGFRGPGEVGGIRAAVDALLDPAVSKAVLGLDVPDDFPEPARHKLAMDVLMHSIDDKERGTELINMHWKVIEVGQRHELLISDSPIWEPTLFARSGDPKSYVAMPIAPGKLFVASNSPRLAAALGMLPPRELVHRQNRATVRQAEHFVGAAGLSADKFIRANFGQAPRPSVTRGIAERYKTAGAGGEV